MKTLRRLFAVALPLGFVAALSAQTPPPDAPHGPRPGRRPPSPIIRALDADKSGGISATGLANATASLRALDLNGDGKLTIDELRPMPPEGAPHRDGPAPRE